MNQVINGFISAINEVGGGFCNIAGSMFVQSSVLILLLLIIDFLIRKRIRATFRYWIWMLVFIKLILPPTLSLPTGVGNLVGDYFTTGSPVLEQQFNITQNDPVIVSSTQEPAEPVEIPMVQTTPAFSEPVTSATPDIPAVFAGTGLNALTWQGIVFMLWFVGVLVITVLLIQRVFFVRGLIAQSEPAGNRLADILNQCREQVSVRRNIELRLSHNVTSPAVCGLFRPVILIPKNLLEILSQDKLKAVLIHELAHIKRGDLFVNSMQTLLQIVYFYNPFIWLANTMVRRIREQAVDEMVLVALGTQAQSYSNTLIDIAEMAFTRPVLSLRLVGVVESKKALSRRIKHILSRPFPKSAKLGIVGLSAIIVTAIVLLPMAKGQMGRLHAAAIGSGSDMYSILLLDNSDSEYEGKELYDDRLYILDRKGNIKGAVSGLNICETFGGAHMMAVDEKRKTLWVVENVGGRLWHFDLTTGKLLQRIPDLKASALAIDPCNSDVWVMTSGGQIGEGSIKVVSASGRIKAEYEIPGFDIAYNSYDKSFWIIGKNIYKVNREGKILGQITGQIPWTAVSVSTDPKTGNAWVVVRAHPQVPDSKPELWIINQDMQIEQRIDLGELIPFCVSIDSDKEVVWVGCLGTTLRFTTSGDKLKAARHISGFSVVPGSSRESVVAASQFGLTPANVKESGYVEIGDMSERFGGQLSSSQKWLAVVPFADATLKSSQELAYLTEYKSWEQKLTEHPESVEKLKSLGRAMFMYANDYDDKFPGTLQDTQGFVGSVELKWLVENVEYRGKGKTTFDPPGIAVAYDKTVLEKGEGTIVLYADSHVAYESPKTLVKIGIIPEVKTNMQIETADYSESPTFQSDKNEKIIGVIKEADGNIGQVTAEHGDAVYGNDIRYTPSLYLGRVRKGVKVQLLNPSVIESQYRIPIIKIKTISECPGLPTGTIGWITLKNTSFKDQFIAHENMQSVQHSYAAKMEEQDKAKIILRANVFSINAPISLITDYLRDELGVNNTTSEMTDVQAAQFKKWMATVPETTMISSPSVLVFDRETASMSVVSNQKEYTVDYEKTSDSPLQYKPVQQKFTTGIELEFTPALTKDNSIIHLTMKFDKTDLVKVEEKTHESGNVIQLPMRNNSQIATQVAVPVGKYFLVSVAGMYPAANSSQPDQPAKQIILLVKADVQAKAGPSDNGIPTEMTGTWFFDNPMGDEEQMAIFPDGRIVVLYSNGHKDLSSYENGFIKLAEYDNARFKINILENGTLIQYPDTETGGFAKRWRRIDSQPQTKLLRSLTGGDDNKSDVGTGMNMEQINDSATDPIVKEMKTITNTMVQAFNTGDIDKLLSYYTDDGIRMPDQVKAAIGKDALRELQMQETKDNVKIQSLKELEKNVYICGDHIFETGQVIISFSKPDTRFLLSDWFNYITIWNRQPDGSLKVKLEATGPAVIPEGGNIPEADDFVMVKVVSNPEPSDDMKAVYEQIRQYENEFHKKFIEHDIDGAIQFYANDAILIPRGQKVVKGKKEILAVIRKSMDQVQFKDITVDVVHVEGNNNMLYAANLFTWTFKDVSTGEDVTIPGKGVHVWTRQQDGSWKILLDLNNVSIPIPGN